MVAQIVTSAQTLTILRAQTYQFTLIVYQILVSLTFFMGENHLRE